MTKLRVIELIEALQECDPNALVWYGEDAPAGELTVMHGIASVENRGATVRLHASAPRKQG